MKLLIWKAVTHCALLGLAAANAEKTIFVAPELEPLPNDASIDNLLLMSLSEAQPSERAFLNATFPTRTTPKGTQTWATLIDLVPGRRYEVRICWLATQPTAFWLHTHTLQSVFESPELLSSMTEYSTALHTSIKPEALRDMQSRVYDKTKLSKQELQKSMLFLQIFAAADYYTLNRTLMETVPPVHADIILDPYLLNVFPKSLLPTAGHIVIVAICGWFISSWIYRSVIVPAATSAHPGAAEDKKVR